MTAPGSAGPSCECGEDDCRRCKPWLNPRRRVEREPDWTDDDQGDLRSGSNQSIF